MASSPGKATKTHLAAEAALRKFALALPETTEAFPWGHRTFKVKGKAFCFLGVDGGGFGLSVKLPQSSGLALTLPFAEPTGYGLGKAGWVSASIKRADLPPVELFEAWLLESYRAVAPKRVLAQLEAAPVSGPAKRKARKTRKG